MSVINTNTKSIVAQNAINVSGRAMSKAMEQLSTGKRINSSADDAAGLAISSKMTSQIRGLNQAVRNANDGISLLQTAEGATVEMTNMLQRMRELAVQSATDTNTTADRANLNSEYQQLKNEITRIANNTEWNGMKILNGNNDFGTAAGAEQLVKFQVGANNAQTIDVSFKDFSFTPGSSSATTSTTSINFAAKTAGTDVARFKGTFGGVNVDIGLTTALIANPDDAAITAMALDMQTKMRAYAGLESVSVTSVGEMITISDPTGKAASAIDFVKADGTAATTPLHAVTYSNGAAGNGAGPVGGGVFTATLAGSTVSTQANSNAAIQELDVSLASLATERAKFGAVMNRLNYAADNLSNVSQNTSASRSRIEDTDYAIATTELARTQIISQAATAMLAQANQAPQSVLSLLR
jgi:flagellin